MTRRGFTLVEVTLAMGVMAIGTLGLISLYSLGYRENQQSVEDVRAAALAQYYLNAMTAALSSTNMTWSAWKEIGLRPEEKGWGAYACDGSGADPQKNASRSSDRLTKSKARSYSKQVFDSVMEASGMNVSFDVSGSDDMCIGIVVNPSDDYRLYSIAVRCSARAGSLVYQPLYYTEVAFQGLAEDQEKGT